MRKQPLGKIFTHGAQEGLTEVGRKVLEGGSAVGSIAKCNNKIFYTEIVAVSCNDWVVGSINSTYFAIYLHTKFVWESTWLSI